MIFLSYPTDTNLLLSRGAIEKPLIPPMRYVWLATLFSCFRSQQRIDLSRAAVIKWTSSGKTWTLVTLLECSFKWETSSRDLISQMRTSPSNPPEQINLLLLLRQMAVTPFLWALSIYHSGLEPSILNERMRPSDQPEIITSSVKREHKGETPAYVRTEHLAITE